MNFNPEVIEKIGELISAEVGRVMPDPQSIGEIEQTMRELLKVVGEKALSKRLEALDAQQPLQMEKPCRCGGKQRYLFRRQATILSVFGRVKYRRRYYGCGQCGQGESPLDRRLGIKAGEVTAGLAELLALLGIEQSFAEASRKLERFVLFRVSDNTIRKETERFGQFQAEEEALWKARSQDEEWLQEQERKQAKRAGRLYGSVDGVMTPCKGEWREMKVVAWYRVEKTPSHGKPPCSGDEVGEQGDLQACDITYHCDLTTAEQFSDLFWATACQRQAGAFEELVFVCDGAPWIWKMIEYHFPQATQIVDWYHASSYLPPIAEAAFGKDTPKYQRWLEHARALLWEGQVDALCAECQKLAHQPAAAQAVQAALSYYRNHQKRLDYARFREQGYFIGSGTVESGEKQIAAQRLKVAGAHWSEEGAVKTAKARAAWLSHQWQPLAQKRARLPLAA